MKKRHLIWLIIFWISISIFSIIWNFNSRRSINTEIVLNKSKAFWEQMITSRLWNSQHGGVYVPITPKTQPNLYLIDSLRDIVTVDGMQLTKINPAYMTRQMAEINMKKYDIQFHITSLNPIRPANKADQWETSALKLFADGSSELLELIQTDSNAIYRYMAPLLTEESCLKCHAIQGYKLGEIRGGISISFSASPFLISIQKQLISDVILHLFIIGLGIMGLIIYYRMSNKYFAVLKSKNLELSESNSTKDKLFSIIAHDLQSPFNVILGYTEQLRTNYDDFNEDERKRIIKEIDHSSKSSFELVSDLLLWAQSQSGKIKLDQKNLNLKETINDAIGPYLSGLKRKNINLELDVSTKLMIYTDKFSIETIIANLFNNAVKFSYEKAKIIIGVKVKDEVVEICITDYGVGIPEENIPKLFKTEENISTKGTAGEKSTGLGLMLCKEFIDKLGGEIWAESKVGMGSSFYFTIPK